jgi:hypothetical protein
MHSVINYYSHCITAGAWKPKHLKTDKKRILTLEAHYEQMNHFQGKRNNSANKDGKQNKYDWKKTPPAAGKSHTYVWPNNGKTYHWCPNHKIRHGPFTPWMNAQKRMRTAHQLLTPRKMMKGMMM